MSNNVKCSPLVLTKKNINSISKKGESLKRINIEKSIMTSSCLTLDVLKKLVQAWNTYSKKQGNTTKSDIIDINQPAESMYAELKRKFDGDNEIFWFEQEAIQSVMDRSKIDEIKMKLYRPIAPDSWNENPEEWLSNFNIEAVLNQYVKKYPEFISYGATPIDFDKRASGIGSSCLVNSICSISLQSLFSKGKKYIGVVFNLDKSGEPGSHWISLFVNIPHGEINFWDSVANNPPIEVERLMSKLENQLIIMKQSKLNDKLQYEKPIKQINKRRHQFKNNECGMYSLYFIIEQLDNNKSFKEVCNKIVLDAKMNAMRKEYFIILDSKPKQNTTSFLGGLFSNN